MNIHITIKYKNYCPGKIENNPQSILHKCLPSVREQLEKESKSLNRDGVCTPVSSPVPPLTSTTAFDSTAAS